MSGLLGLSAQVTFSIRGVAIDMAFGNVGALCSRRVFLRWTFATRVGVRPKAVSNDAAQVYNAAIANAQTSQSIYRRVVGSWWVARSAACLGGAGRKQAACFAYPPSYEGGASSGVGP